MSRKPIYVTQPFMPPLDQFSSSLNEIWESRTLTNGGPFHQRLEQALCGWLGVPHISLFNNGTIALIAALEALALRGEVITTPYSFVATAHSLLWAGLDPVFVDIDPETLNIDPRQIEAAVTPRTAAILPVHCYGRPCDVDAIASVAAKHNLKVIYDAAHAFGVRRAGVSVLCAGDLSILSFHATKVFSTFEGGAVVAHDRDMKEKVDRIKNFGIVDEENVCGLGLNGKMNEVCAAFGLLQLPYMDEVITARRAVDAFYRVELSGVAGITCLGGRADPATNYAYFPILVDETYGLSRDELMHRLRAVGVFTRRYFYPLISDLPAYRERSSATYGKLPVAERAARSVLCLPIYHGLANSDLQRVVDTIRGR